MTTEPCILIFGGTFDPPHRAHVELPPRVADSLGCERLIYVPARINPLKSDRPSPGEDRVAMLDAALRHQPNVQISRIELNRDGPSYFIDTLREIAEMHPDATLRFLIGCDQALEFDRWRAWEEILVSAEPVVMLRPPWTRENLHAALTERQGPAQADWWLEHLASESLPRIDVSATMIRERLARNQPIDDLVTDEVAAYIRAHKLYA